MGIPVEPNTLFRSRWRVWLDTGGPGKLVPASQIVQQFSQTILKDTQGALRPRAFIGMSNGSSLPAMPFPYNAVAVGSAIDALGVPTVLVELTPTTFALGSALTQTEADDMSASLGFTIPAKFWNSSNWLASP